jgi:hypothetical protein
MFMNRKQFALLRVAKEKLGLSGEQYRDILKAHGGVWSAKDLNEEGCQSARKRDPRSASNRDPLMRMRDFPSLRRREGGARPEAQAGKVVRRFSGAAPEAVSCGF